MIGNFQKRRVCLFDIEFFDQDAKRQAFAFRQPIG